MGQIKTQPRTICEIFKFSSNAHTYSLVTSWYLGNDCGHGSCNNNNKLAIVRNSAIEEECVEFWHSKTADRWWGSPFVIGSFFAAHTVREIEEYALERRLNGW